MTNDRILHDAVALVASVVRNIQLKRALQAADPNPPLNFWRLMNGNSFDMAVIDWCKLFGSERDPLHWKNVLPEAEWDEFRAGLLRATDFSADEWAGYREKVKEYRDKHAAHFDPTFIEAANEPEYPALSEAFYAACLYYDRLCRLFADRGIKHRYPRDIRDYSRRFADQTAEVAKKAIEATKGLKERVQ